MSSTTIGTPARARSSLMPSCWAARHGSRPGAGASPPVSSKCRSAVVARPGPSRSRERRARSTGSGRACPDAVARRITKRRLFGIDRSGPPPRATRSDQPLNPWTIPNAIGYVRLALIPVFLAVALSSDNGKDTLAAVLYAVIGCADYLDGFAARLTGQYSRLGALLDPIVDRLLIVSGMVVVYHFSLLPRWAILVVVARELFMLALSRYALHRGLELRINW